MNDRGRELLHYTHPLCHLHVLLPSFLFVSRLEHFILIVKSCREYVLGENLCDGEEEDDSEREDVQLAGVVRGKVPTLPGLWRHVHAGPRELGQLSAEMQGIDDPGHTKVGNLGHQCGVEQHVPG